MFTAFLCVLGAVVGWWLVGLFSLLVSLKLNVDLEDIEKGMKLTELIQFSFFGPICTLYVICTMIIPRVKYHANDWYENLPIWNFVEGLSSVYVVKPREITDEDRERYQKYPPGEMN